MLAVLRKKILLAHRKNCVFLRILTCVCLNDTSCKTQVGGTIYLPKKSLSSRSVKKAFNLSHLQPSIPVVLSTLSEETVSKPNEKI